MAPQRNVGTPDINLKEEFKLLEAELGIPWEEIKKVYRLLFKGVSQAMKEGSSVRIPYFGIFKVNEEKVRKINEQRNNS